MIVIDASLGVELFLRGPDAMAIKDRIEAAGREMAAPEIFDLEILQTFRRLKHRKQIEPDRAVQALDVFRHAPIDRYSHRLLNSRIWELRDNLTAYDAAYFALAELLDVPLWTREARFSEAPGASTMVRVL